MKKIETSKFIILSMIANTFLSICKIVFGYIFVSSAIISDGFHSLSDLITDIVAIFGLNKSYEKYDEEHPFGHGKIEYVTSLFVGFIIIFFAYELFKNILTMESGIPNLLGIYVILVTIVIKIIVSNTLIKNGEKKDNQILISSGHESMNDVLSSIIVLIGLLISQIDFKYNIYIDKFIALVVVLFILKTGILIIRDNINLILGVNADKRVIDKLKRDILRNVEEVEYVEHFLLLKYGPYYKAIVDIQIYDETAVREGHEIGTKVKNLLLENENIDYVKVHIEPYEDK